MMKKMIGVNFLILFIIVFSSCATTENNVNLKQESLQQPLSTRIENLAINSKNEILFAGYTNGSTLPLTSSFHDNERNAMFGFAGKMNHEGDVKWVSYLGEGQKNIAIHMTVNLQDELYVFYRLIFENDTDSHSKDGLYVAKFSNNGKQLLNKQIYDYQLVKKNQIAINVLNEHVYLLVPNELSFDKNDSNNPQADRHQNILISLALSGEVQWTQQVYGLNPVIHLSNNNEKIFIVSSTDVPDLKTKNAFQDHLNGEMDLFITCFSNNGNHLWSSYYGGINNEHVLSITTGPQDSLYILGTTNSPKFFKENEGYAEEEPNESIYQLFAVSFNAEGIFDTLTRFQIWHHYMPYTTWEISYNKLDQKLVLAGSNWDTHLYEHETISDFEAFEQSGYGFFHQPGDHDIFLLSYDVKGSMTNWGSYYFGQKDEDNYQISMLGAKDIVFDTQGNIFLTGIIVQSLDHEHNPFPNHFFSSLPSSSLTTIDSHPSFFMKINPFGHPDFFSLFGNQ